MALQRIVLTVSAPDDVLPTQTTIEVMNSLDFKNTDFQLHCAEVAQPEDLDNSEIQNTRNWFVTSGQMQLPPVLNVRQTAFYLGMQLEEMAEKLEALFPGDQLAASMQTEAMHYKNGKYDSDVGFYLASETVREALLDADCDLLWVTIGAGYAQGADVRAAYQEVSRANWDKFPNGVVTRDELTGKVIKPAGWKAPDLTPFISKDEVSNNG